jgi:hypothetical protein
MQQKTADLTAFVSKFKSIHNALLRRGSARNGLLDTISAVIRAVAQA